MIPTPHIEASRQDQIAPSILLPGDPLRARFIAENFLSDVEQFNSIRNMLGYTGCYNGKRVSVMGTGMGMPSIALYTYELIHFYGVKNLIRIGSCGAMQPDLELNDIIAAMSACTDSAYARQFSLPGDFAPTAAWKLLQQAALTAKQKKINLKVGSVVTSDTFYDADPESWKKWAAMGVLAVEMEAAALYINAAYAKVDALALFTVSDSMLSKAVLTAAERQTAFVKMIELALEMVADPQE